MSFCYSTDDERFLGEFDTAEEAAEEAFNETDAMEVSVGESVDPSTWITPEQVGEDIVERLQEQLGDECGEVAECFDPSRDESREIGALVLKWVADHGGFHCYAVKNIQKIQRTANNSLSGPATASGVGYAGGVGSPGGSEK
jgi:hypothetical protein